MNDRRLVGVGLGPGDPELLTGKAARMLREADVVLVCAGEEGYPQAMRILTECGAPAPMPAGPAVTARSGEGQEESSIGQATRPAVGEPAAAYGEHSTDAEQTTDVATLVDRARAAFRQGAVTVAVATLGDPSLYSPFGAVARGVLETVPDARVEVLPGITAMQALAAASATPLVEGSESLALVSATAGLAAFTDALEHSDTVVAYEGGRYLAAMHGELSRRGRLSAAVLGRDVGLEDETITALADRGTGGAAEKSITVIVSAARDGRAGTS